MVSMNPWSFRARSISAAREPMMRALTLVPRTRDGFGLLPGLLTDVELRNGCGKQVRVRASKHHRNPSNACQYAARISLAPQAFGSTTPQYQSERLTGSASS